jgi:hypothetical protein
VASPTTAFVYLTARMVIALAALGWASRPAEAK